MANYQQLNTDYAARLHTLMHSARKHTRLAYFGWRNLICYLGILTAATFCGIWGWYLLTQGLTGFNSLGRFAVFWSLGLLALACQVYAIYVFGRSVYIRQQRLKQDLYFQVESDPELQRLHRALRQAGAQVNH